MSILGYRNTMSSHGLLSFHRIKSVISSSYSLPASQACRTSTTPIPSSSSRVSRSSPSSYASLITIANARLLYGSNRTYDVVIGTPSATKCTAYLVAFDKASNHNGIVLAVVEEEMQLLGVDHHLHAVHTINSDLMNEVAKVTGMPALTLEYR